jgi:hypothetical protein
MIITSIYNVIWHIDYCLSCVSAHVGRISNLNLDFIHNASLPDYPSFLPGCTAAARLVNAILRRPLGKWEHRLT